MVKVKNKIVLNGKSINDKSKMIKPKKNKKQI